ncbi:S8 family serine peptidase [Nonomuraea sp. 3N208]|uniref:S8 family serine peptidase n=1 Tax=Nonomuraea sp. 3N208 TaxID=3457421 RepID=UPI003FCDD84B
MKRVATAALLGVALAAGITTPASAEDPPTTTRGGKAVSSHTITLVTGDVIRLVTYADGSQDAAVDGRTGKADNWDITEMDGQLHAIPAKAEPYLAAKVLDRDLFNLTELVASGYDDASRKHLPVLATYGKSVRAAAARQPEGATKDKTLPSINGAALEVAKDKATAFWDATVQEGRNKLDGGLAGIWLDRKVKATLDRSVPQVGAPKVWASGFDGTGVKVAVLDTGIDDTHPDLAGRVKLKANFTEEADAYDDHFHGTHVASTIAGTGTAGGGKGVAPGADLLVGKVLDQHGDGTESQVIAGMEWAVAQGAEIVSMSLGAPATDGTDPMAKAVDRLSESGTLFVVAAGNNGRARTINTPGSATSALTVGAVDGNDALAPFSSRGPRRGDNALKPDITAPGVDITAARTHPRDGSTEWTPYLDASGTSMATPHVAGAAALLKQQHPGWKGRQLKAALMSSATPNQANSVYEQGAGRLDADRAHRQSVQVSHGSLDFGFHDWPHDPAAAPIVRTLTYTNPGAQEVALTVAPSGPFTPDATTLTLPANGSAELKVTYNATAVEPGNHSGWLTAAAQDGTVVRTALGAVKEGEMYDVRVPVLARNGQPADAGTVELWGVDTPYFQEVRLRDDPAPVFHVPPGRYSLMAFAGKLDASGRWSVEFSVLGNPELEVRADMTVTLDARQANPVRISTPKESEARSIRVGYRREAGGRGMTHSGLLIGFYDTIYASPTPQVTTGFFEFYSKWDLMAPDIKAEVNGTALDLEVMGVIDSVRFDGRARLPVTYVGSGHPEDYAGKRMRGRLALVKRTDGVDYADQVRNAADAGAQAVLVFNDRPGVLAGYVYDGKIPAFWTGQDEGQRLLGLLEKGTVQLALEGIPYSPYLYEGIFPEQGRIPEKLTYEISPRTASRAIARYTSSGTGSDHYFMARFYKRPYRDAGFVSAFDFPAPFVREEWVTGGDTVWNQEVIEGKDFSLGNAFYTGRQTHTAGQQLETTWLGAVLRPGPADFDFTDQTPQPPSRHEGDGLFFSIAGALDSSSAHLLPYAMGANGTSRARLYRNDELIAEEGTLNRQVFTVPPEPAAYRVELDQEHDGTEWALSTKASTAWTFTSERPAQGAAQLPLLFVDYNLGLDLHNTAPRRLPYTFGLKIGHRLPQGPKMARAKIWASFDDGATWQETKTHGRDGTYTVDVRHPARGGSGFVSLRVEAADSAGNSVKQTVIRAYRLR